MIRKVGALSLLLLSDGALFTEASLFGFSRLNTTNLIPEWLPGCFETDNLATFSECLGDYVLDPTCLSDAENAYFTIASCALDALGFDALDTMLNFDPEDSSFTDASTTIFAFRTDLRVCMDPLVPCISSTIENIIEEFLEPTCLPAKISNLTECARQNGVACQDSCRDAWATTAEGGNPWEGLDENSVSTCDGIQSEVMDPFCEVLNCCEPCVQHYEELMECLVNEVFNNTGDVCDFECTAPLGRRRLRSPLHTLSDKNVARKLEQMDLFCLQYAAGCSSANECAQFFLPCVATQFAEEIEAVGPGTDGDTTYGEGTGDYKGLARRDFNFWSGNTADDLVPEWMPQCFQLGDNSMVSFLGVYGCLEENSGGPCFNITNFETVLSCATDALGEIDFDDMSVASSNNIEQALEALNAFTNATRECLAPLVDCVNATIQERIVSTLEPTCLPANLRAVESCVRDNGIACQAACDAAWKDQAGTMEMSLEGLNDGAELGTCSGIQSNIVDPSCVVVTCCEPCVEPYEKLMECVFNEVLNITGESCEFQCPGVSLERRRRRALRNTPVPAVHQEAAAAVASLRILEGGDGTTAVADSDLLSFCLQYAPGLTGDGVEEVMVRAPRFIPCVNAGLVTVIGNAVANNVINDTTTTDTTTAANNTIPGDSDDNNNNPTNNTAAGGATAEEGNANADVGGTTTEEIKGDDNTSSAVTAAPGFWTQGFLLVVTTTGSLWVLLV